MTRYAKMPRSCFLRQVFMRRYLTAQRFPIQLVGMLGTGLTIGQRIGRVEPVVNTSPRNLKTTSCFSFAATVPDERYYPLA